MIIKTVKTMYIARRFDYNDSGVTEYRIPGGWSVNPDNAFLFETPSKAGAHAKEVEVTTYCEILG